MFDWWHGFGTPPPWPSAKIAGVCAESTGRSERSHPPAGRVGPHGVVVPQSCHRTAMAQMEPDLSRRNVRRLAREYGLPEGAIRQMLTIEAGTNRGDVVESAPPRPRWRLVLWGLVAVPPVAASLYLVFRHFA